MSRAEARFTHLAVAASGITGLVYGWLRYFVEPVDEFALVNHPAEPWWKALHILLVPLLLMAFGLVFRDHIWAKWRSGARPRRRTGLVLATLFAPMVFSGYLLQISGDPAWRQIWLVLHLVSSLVWLPFYAIHQFTRV